MNSAARNTQEPLSIKFRSKQTCPKHGPYDVPKVMAFGAAIPRTQCPNCVAEREAKEKANAKRELFMKLLDQAEIPKRFRKVTLDGYQTKNPGQKDALSVAVGYVRNFGKLKDDGCSLVFCGPPGTGKTHLACGIGKRIMGEYGVSVRYAQVLKIMQRVKNTFSRDAEEREAQVLEDYIQPGLLIFDEVGVQFGTDTEKMVTYQIINGRYENMMPTIMISNLTEPELCQYIGERSVDRMREGGGAVISFDWESWRK